MKGQSNALTPTQKCWPLATGLLFVAYHAIHFLIINQGTNEKRHSPRATVVHYIVQQLRPLYHTSDRQLNSRHACPANNLHMPLVTQQHNDIMTKTPQGLVPRMPSALSSQGVRDKQPLCMHPHRWKPPRCNLPDNYKTCMRTAGRATQGAEEEQPRAARRAERHGARLQRLPRRVGGGQRGDLRDRPAHDAVRRQRAAAEHKRARGEHQALAHPAARTRGAHMHFWVAVRVPLPSAAQDRCPCAARAAHISKSMHQPVCAACTAPCGLHPGRPVQNCMHLCLGILRTPRPARPRSPGPYAAGRPQGAQARQRRRRRRPARLCAARPR